MQLRNLTLAIVVLGASTAMAQLPADNPDWTEEPAQPAPSFSVDNLVEFEVSATSPLKFGVDPATIRIGKDGVVRYVVVAKSSTGALNAFYEGIRCTTREFKTYARYNPSGGWNKVQTAQWLSLDNPTSSRHTLRLAKQGACADNAPPQSVAEIVRSLKVGGAPVIYR